MDATLSRLIAITQDFADARADIGGHAKLDESSAISQEAMIFGIDVEDYVWELEREFGDVVWQIPWKRYTDQTFSFRGCSVGLVPFLLLWRSVAWLWRGGPIIPGPDPVGFPHRLELSHIVAVIDRGEWFEP